MFLKNYSVVYFLFILKLAAANATDLCLESCYVEGFGKVTLLSQANEGTTTITYTIDANLCSIVEDIVTEVGPDHIYRSPIGAETCNLEKQTCETKLAVQSKTLEAPRNEVLDPSGKSLGISYHLLEPGMRLIRQKRGVDAVDFSHYSEFQFDRVNADYSVTTLRIPLKECGTSF